MNPPRFAVPKDWGICFAGNESAFCAALDTALEAAGSNPFIYLEIGLGHGATMRAVDAYLTATSRAFTLKGVDLPNCSEQARDEESYPHPDKTEIYLYPEGASQFLRGAEKAHQKANFIFIDGCHGAPCVTADFLGAEKIIEPGGVVAFHDTDQGCQDIHWQDHCQSGIRARSAVQKLGLLDDTRPGWQKIGETTGDKVQGGHGCLFVQRV